MGVRGHPAGQTVLSYFPWKIDGLLPLDKVMLRALVFAAHGRRHDALRGAAGAGRRTGGHRARQGGGGAGARPVLRDHVQQMHAYANGQGDVPAVVKRSGKATTEGIRYGRGEMSYFLGIAYLEGVTVPRDATQAVRWLERAATMGNRGAQAKLGAFR